MKATILTDLIYAAIPIENRVNDLISSATQEEFDINKTPNTLINEAFSTLLELLSENGIEFHVDHEELRSDQYNMGFVIFLYKFFNTVDIIHRIKTTPKYLENLASGLISVNDSEILVTMIDILQRTTELSYHKDFYNFINDKVTNTEKYAQFIIRLVDQMMLQQDEIDIVLDDTDVEFLNQLAGQKHWFQLCVANIINKGALPINDKSIKVVINRCCQLYQSPENVKILSRYEENYTLNELFINSYMQKLKRLSELHIEYYNDSDIMKLPLHMIVGIILMQNVDFHLFKIKPDYSKLIEFSSADIPIKNIIDIVQNYSQREIDQ